MNNSIRKPFSMQMPVDLLHGLKMRAARDQVTLSSLIINGLRPLVANFASMPPPPPTAPGVTPPFDLATYVPASQGGPATPQELYNYRPKPNRVRQLGWDNQTWNMMREEWECQDMDEDRAVKQMQQAEQASTAGRTYGGDDE